MKFALARAVRAFTRGGVATLAMMTLATISQAATIVSDGSDGEFNGGGTVQLDTDGIFNFTNITIPNGATLRLTPNAANTPAVLAATGDVIIDGTIDVSAGHFSRLAYGPGGGSGGLAGNGAEAGSAGTGPSPGEGGEFPPTLKPGNAGGGGGMGTPGLVATQYTNSAPGAGGGMISFPGPVGGSGGGGGSGWLFFGVELGGGVGGAAGGGLLITTPGTITVNGSILANGGHAGWAFANIGGFGGPGGGGSGGNIMLEAAEISLGATTTISALGGAGGGLSTQPVPNDPFFYSNEADGGLGYLALVAGTVTIDPAATVDAAVVPLPPAIWLFGSVLLAGGLRRRNRAWTIKVSALRECGRI